MPTTAPTRAAVYIKETTGYPDGENSKELQTEARLYAKSRKSNG